MQSIKLIVSGVVVLSIIVTLSSASPTTAPKNNDEEPLAMGPDGSLFLAGTECGPDEQLAPGALPTCEPTCDNPRPVCHKVFFSGIDYVPCFCKSPKVRNLKTKQCVALSECPQRT